MNTTARGTNYVLYTNVTEELLWETALSMLIVLTKIDTATQMAYYITEKNYCSLRSL